MPKEMVFFNGGDYFDSLVSDIQKAVKKIDIEVYIFQSDQLGQRLLEHLIKAAERGIKIRILVDGAGTPGWQNIFTEKLKKAHIQTHVYHPFLWRFWQHKQVIMRMPLLLRIFYFLFKTNHRNHRKVCIVDQKIVYIGSANISMCHLPVSKGGEGWRDTIIRLEEINTHDLEIAFNACWKHTPIKEKIKNIFKKPYIGPVVRLNNTRRRRRILRKQLIRMIKQCKERIWITNAYFVPDNHLLKTLQERAQTGVDVRIILPEKSDIFIMPLASTAFYKNLLNTGIRIFEYTPGMLHAKTLILDNKTLIGSSNLNHRSLLHDLEVDVEVQEQATKLKIHAQFLQDLSLSEEINLQNWYKKGWFKNNTGRLLLYLKYWI